MCNEEAQMMNIQYKVSDDKNVVESWVKTVLKLDNFNEKDDVEGVVVKIGTEDTNQNEKMV